MKRSTLPAVLPLLLIAVCMTPVEARSSTFEGEWRHTQLIEDEQSSPNCRWLHVTTRRYDLGRDLSGRYTGFYSREYFIKWLGPAIDCPEPARLNNVQKSTRIDLWQLFESDLSGGRLNIVAEHFDCKGNCSNETPAARQFNALLTLEDGVLMDDPGREREQIAFIPESSAQSAEDSAAERMFDLIEPMYTGECNRYFEDSLDPSVQRNMPKAQLCMIFQRLEKLMPPILYHKPSFSTFFTYGRFKRITDGTPMEVWGGLDVLVEQFFVVTPEGGHVPVSTILRRQPDDTWKILVPIP